MPIIDGGSYAIRFFPQTAPAFAALHLKWQNDFPIVFAPPLQDAAAG
jgi:hypothetical protein